LSWDVPFVVGVVRSSHTVEHGMTAEILGSKLDHCRHLGEGATNRQWGSEICVDGGYSTVRLSGG
jgi:hypothetical protein